MRSLLFVPADSPRKLARAAESGTDALILDLEDSVAPDRKAAARASAADFIANLATSPRPALIVRINALDSGHADADLDAVVAARPDMILLPKAAGGADVIHADAKIAVREAMAGIDDGHVKIVALATETAASLFLTGTFAHCSRRLAGLTWGAEDLSADVGASANRDANGHLTDLYRLARSLCLAGAAAAGVRAYDTVHVDFRDEAGLRHHAAAARRDGFAGKLAIHPAQVPIINEVFAPSEDEIARARSLVAAFEAAPGLGVVAVDGVMYDRPHLRRALRLLGRDA